MKVLIVSPCILPVPAVKGGAVLTLIESIIKQNETKRSFELTVVGSYNQQAENKAQDYPNTKFIFIQGTESYEKVDVFIDQAISILRRGKKSNHYLWKLHVISEIKRILKTNDYDRVIFQNSGYLLNILKDKDITEKYKDKLYYHLHNDIPNNVYVEGVKKCKLLLISRYLLKKVNQVCKCDMSDQAYIVKNGFDVQKFTRLMPIEEKIQLKQKLGIQDDKKVIVFAGRITEYKGIKELASAVSSMNDNSLVLLIIGSFNFGSGETSAFENELKQILKKIEDRVIWTGFIPYDDMWKYYKLADVAVLPSMWEEPAGLTMIEAAASNVPVVTTYSGGIPEYLNDQLAYFVHRDENIVHSIQNAINDILSNSSEWNEKSSEASEYVMENFSEEIYYNTFTDALHLRGKN